MNNDKPAISYTDRIIDKRYKIVDTVGSGGMSVVYKAQDLVMNRYVALKLLNDELSTNEKAIRRFANESKAVAMISSEHIVKVYDVNLDHNPKYIAMEYVSGCNLKEYMEKNAPLPIDQAVSLISQLLSALRYTHDKGIVHLDVKPQNVMITEDLRLKLTDFGIARLPGEESTEEKEKAMGTVHYMSPEQANGSPVDFNTDVYSAGVIFYEMLTGRLPFEGDTPLSVAMMHINNPPVPPGKYNPSIPAALEQIILKTMEKDPAARFRSAASMRRALKLYQKDNAIVFEQATLDSIDETSVEQPKPKDKKPKKKKKKTKHGRRTMFPIIFGVSCAFFMVFLFAAVFMVVSLVNMTKDSSITIVVPDLSGQQYSSEYAKSLEDDNLKITSIEYVYDSDAPSGVIVEQTPKAGQRKKLADNSQFCEISVKISRGNETVIVPDITVTEYRNALILLEEESLRYKIVQTNSSTILDGYVISTEPSAGTVVSKNSEVTVYVSLGQEISFTSMPNLTGKTLSEVKTLLAQSSLTLGKVTREPSQSPTGTVLTQSIEAGKSIPMKYTVVDVVLSIKIPDHPLPLPTNTLPASSSKPATTVTQPPAASTTQTVVPGTSTTPPPASSAVSTSSGAVSVVPPASTSASQSTVIPSQSTGATSASPSSTTSTQVLLTAANVTPSDNT